VAVGSKSRVSPVVRAFLLIGLLFSLSAGCSPGITPIESASPTVSDRVATFTGENASIATRAVPEKRSAPTPIKTSTAATETVDAALETHIPATEALTITIVYDNNGYDERLKSAWGFSVLVEYRNHLLLFDTGGEGPTLMSNMRILEIDPTQIESVVLSHAHGDHTGGLSALLEAGASPVVYLLPSFPDSFKRQVEQFTSIVEVSPGQSITEGLFTTGEMARSTPEQALVIRTEQGLVIVTGCAHPGIVAIVEQAQEMFAEPIHLVLGGFHLGSKSIAEIDAILRDFRRLGVEQVAPCHCTGERAISMFAAEYGEDFISAGVGRVIRLDVTAPK